jgi:hypothetical protein
MDWRKAWVHVVSVRRSTAGREYVAGRGYCAATLPAAHNHLQPAVGERGSSRELEAGMIVAGAGRGKVRRFCWIDHGGTIG